MLINGVKPHWNRNRLKTEPQALNLQVEAFKFIYGPIVLTVEIIHLKPPPNLKPVAVKPFLNLELFPPKANPNRRGQFLLNRVQTWTVSYEPTVGNGWNRNGTAVRMGEPVGSR